MVSIELLPLQQSIRLFYYTIRLLFGKITSS